jgi:hypothetical protein
MAASLVASEKAISLLIVVCGLLGAALGLVGLHIYSIVDELNHLGGLGGIRKGEILAAGLRDMLWEDGSLLGLAMVVYLLAPRAEVAKESAASAS